MTAIPSESFFREPRPGRRRPHASRRRRLGAYTVEFAICLPVFFTLVFGCLELARFMYVRQALDQSAYEAARMGIATGARIGDVRDQANLMLTAYGVTASEVTVSPNQITEDTETVTVQIVCDFSANSWVLPRFALPGILESRVTLDHENQAYLVPENVEQDESLSENDEPLDV